MKRPVVLVGTRGSRLAMVQTREVLALLQACSPKCLFRVKVIQSRGDTARDAPLDSLGVSIFTKELELALLRREVDMVVHSLKDLATQLPLGLVIGAVPSRHDPRDVLICRWRGGLQQAPAGARVGTSSPRRMVQLKAMRQDIRVLPIRGNVDTRVKKALEGQFDGVVVAAAGVLRLGLQDQISEYFDPHSFLPQVGQGALAVQAREEDREVLAMLRPLNHPPTVAAVTAERAFLATMGGGCRVPITAYGEVQEGRLYLWGLVASEDGRTILRADLKAPASQAEEAGRRLAQRLMALGAAEVVGGTTKVML